MTEESRPTPDWYIPRLWEERYAKMIESESPLLRSFFPKPLRRSWRERLFSLPWRPWNKWRREEPKRTDKYEVHGDRVKIRKHDDDMIDSVKYAFGHED